MLLHPLAQFGNQALRLLRQQLRQRERRDSLDQRCPQHHQHKPIKQVKGVLGDDVIEQELGGVGKNKAGDPVNNHQQKADAQQANARTGQLPNDRENGAQSLNFWGLLGCFRVCTQSLIGLRQTSIRFIITAL